MLQPSSNGPINEAESTQTRPQLQPQPAPALDPAWRAGRKLTEARRQLGLSLEQVADRIRIRREFLEALEDMNVKLLPGKAYALAFLRSYARELGIDERAIVDQFQDECALSREDAKKPIRNPSSKPRRERPWVWAAGLLIAAAAFAGWQSLESATQPEAVGEAPLSAAVGAPADQAPSAVRRVVEIKALADAWLEARGPDGTVFLSQELHTGQVYRPDESPGWTLHARDGGAFEVFVNGVSVGPLGQTGMPVLGRQIDEIQAAPSAPTAS